MVEEKFCPESMLFQMEQSPSRNPQQVIVRLTNDLITINIVSSLTEMVIMCAMLGSSCLFLR